jgi:arabinan endo-1,5-alpha-L-arabinosidase
MLRGGSHRVLATEGNKIGPGGQSVINDPIEGDILVYHYYDANDGIPMMDIKKLEWKGGWPTPVNFSRRRLAQLKKRMKNRKLL